MNELWAIHILMFLLTSTLLFYSDQAVRRKVYKWFRQGLLSAIAFALYCSSSYLFFLRQFYGDVKATSLRDEWKALVILATISVVASFLIILRTNVLMSNRDSNYTWQKEGLFSAAMVTFCNFLVMNIFIRTH